MCTYFWVTIYYKYLYLKKNAAYFIRTDLTPVFVGCVSGFFLRFPGPDLDPDPLNLDLDPQLCSWAVSTPPPGSNNNKVCLFGFVRVYSLIICTVCNSFKIVHLIFITPLIWKIFPPIRPLSYIQQTVHTRSRCKERQKYNQYIRDRKQWLHIRHARKLQ